MLHRLRAERVHHSWDNSLEPVLEIDSGDTVVFEVRSGADGFFTWESTSADVVRRPLGKGPPLTGPVRIRDARAGETLQIEILELQPGEMGYTSIMAGKGLLPEDFPEPFLKIWDLRTGSTAQFRPGIEVPIEPFLGRMGLAPAEPGAHHTTPPRRTGGNMDIKQLTVGTTLFLPIEVDGGLFSTGDSHAAQGDGEVCVSAIETSMTATLRFTVRPDLQIATPRFRTGGPLTPRTNTAGWYATTGIAPDLMLAAKQATREMITYLAQTYSLSRPEAYVLCSAAMDLKISEVVDAPNWVVSAFIPLSIFGNG
jgi:acetamidase/formamidase